MEQYLKDKYQSPYLPRRPINTNYHDDNFVPLTTYQLIPLVVDQTDCPPAVAYENLIVANNDVVFAIMRIRAGQY